MDIFIFIGWKTTDKIGVAENRMITELHSCWRSVKGLTYIRFNFEYNGFLSMYNSFKQSVVPIVEGKANGDLDIDMSM